MNIQKIQLIDKSISNPETVEFTTNCLGQIHGYPGVANTMKNRGLLDIADRVRTMYDETLKSGADELKLAGIESKTLREVCAAIIDTLSDYEDLEIIMTINKDTAYNLLSKI